MKPPNEWHKLPQEEVLKHHEAAPSELRSDASLATTLAGAGKMAEALEKLHEAIALDPTNARAFNGLGAIQADMGQEEEALESMRQAVQLAPDDYASHWGLGFMLHKYNHQEEARVELAIVMSLVNEFAKNTARNEYQFVSGNFFAGEAQKLLNTL